MFVEVKRSFSKASKPDHRQVQKRTRSEKGPLLNKTNICRFSSARLKLMTSRECADRENGIGLCTRGPARPDICFGKCCGWSMASKSVCLCVCVCVCGSIQMPENQERQKIGPCFFFCSSFIHQCLYKWMKRSV